MADHSSPEALVRWVEAEQQGAPIEPVDRRHIDDDGCALCRDRLAATRVVYLAFQAAPLTSPPPAWSERALERLRASGERAPARSRLVRAVKQAVEEIAAALRLDTHAGTLLPGIRGAMTVGARQMLFEAKEARIHLRIVEVSARRFQIEGQVVPEPGLAELETGLALLRSGKKTLRSPLSIHGEFAFQEVPAGIVSLRIECGARALLVESFTLAGPES